MPTSLQSIIEGKETSKCVLIQDNVDQSGRGLLKCFLSNLVSRSSHTHILLTQPHPHKFCSHLNPSQTQKITIHDGRPDPCGWDDSLKTSSNQWKIFSSETDIVQHIKDSLDVCGGDEQKAVVIIDSISDLILQRGVTQVCQILHHLSQLKRGDVEVLQVVSLLHGDLHDETSQAMLQHCCSSCIKVATPGNKTDYHLSCDTIHKRTSGKVHRNSEQLRFAKNWTLVSCDEHVTYLSSDSRGAGDADPTANLTFNLSLSDKEKQDRSNLVLPYIRQHVHKPKAEESRGEEGGKIFYTPDDVDDFDEEDPDDDLDI